MQARVTSIRRRVFNSPFPYLVSDVLAMVIAYYVTWWVRFQSNWGNDLFTWINVSLGVRGTAEVGPDLEAFYLYNAPRILCLLAATLLFLYAFLDLYGGRRFIRRPYVSRNMLMANLTALALFYSYFYLTRNQYHPRSVFATLLMLNTLMGIAGRHLTAQFLKRSLLIRCPALLLGETPDADFVARYIALRQPHGITINVRLPFNPDERMDTLVKRIAEAVERHGTRMIIAADKRLSVTQIMQILECSESLGQEVKVLSDNLNVLVNEAGLPADFFRETPLVHFAVPSAGFPAPWLRHALVRLTAAVLLALALPLFLLIALLIKATSRGPVWFVQERIGINRKPFNMIKFRTMYNRAEELQAQIEELNDSGEGLFKIKADPRVTPVGWFLRRFSLDELPQLINVVRGEMTLVGPRPLPRRDFENYYEEWHYGRHSGLPGLTCLWQVSGRSDISFHNMCILDDYYLRNRNAMLDLKIILRTIGVVIFAKGAY